MAAETIETLHLIVEAIPTGLAEDCGTFDVIIEVLNDSREWPPGITRANREWFAHEYMKTLVEDVSS